MNQDYDHINEYLNVLNPNIRALISDFTVLWNAYEKVLFDTHFSPLSIYTKVIKKMQFDERTNYQIEIQYNDLLEYFKSREIRYEVEYIWKEYTFEGKKQTDEQKEKLKDILSKSMYLNDSKQHLIFLLLIISRVRNNMFHGIKPIKMLNAYEQLFIICNKTLDLVLDKTGHLKELI